MTFINYSQPIKLVTNLPSSQHLSTHCLLEKDYIKSLEPFYLFAFPWLKFTKNCWRAGCKSKRSQTRHFEYCEEFNQSHNWEFVYKAHTDSKGMITSTDELATRTCYSWQVGSTTFPNTPGTLKEFLSLMTDKPNIKYVFKIFLPRITYVTYRSNWWV